MISINGLEMEKMMVIIGIASLFYGLYAYDRDYIVNGLNSVKMPLAK